MAMTGGKIVMYAMNEAPHPVSAVFTETGGSGWDTGEDYYILVVAWYSASEANIYQAGTLNVGFKEDMIWSVTLQTLAQEVLTPWQAGAPTGATDTLTVTWIEPTHEVPHHYSVYYKLTTGATGIWTKLNAADIAPGTTSAVFTSPADESVAATAYVQDVGGTGKGDTDACTNAAPSTTVCTCATATFISDYVVVGDIVNNTTTGKKATVVSVDSETQLTTTAITGSYTAADNITVTEPPLTITVAGNILASAGPGATMDTGGSSGTVARSELIYNARGVNTLITFDASLPGGAAVGSTLNYKQGLLTIFQSSPGWGVPAFQVLLYPVNHVSPVINPLRYRSYLGNVKRASSNYDSDISQLVITIGSTGVQTYKAWAGELMNWLNANTTVWLTDIYGDPSDTAYPRVAQYIGKIGSVDNVGSLGKNANPTFTIVFEVERCDPQGQGLSWGTV